MSLVNTLEWQATDERGAYVATIACDAGTTNIGIQTGSLFRGEVQVVPRYMLVDNLANNASVGLVFGPFTYTVPRFTREVFKLPVPVAYVSVTATIGPVNVTFGEVADGLISGSDQFAIQQSANRFVTYEWLTKTAGGAQLTTDQNFNLNLTAATDQTYTLLPIGSDTPNGWYNPEVKNLGTGRWSITPDGANQINGIYTSAIPLKLSLGDKVSLWCDGSQWIASGRISIESAEIAFTNALLTTFAHGLGKRPQVGMFIRCKTAEGGYSVGDEVVYGPWASDGAGAVVPWGNSVDATNVIIRNLAAERASVGHKTTGALFNITLGNWRKFVRCYVDL